MKLLKNLIESMQFVAEMRALGVSRQKFISMSDRQLDDIGISHDLLERGVGAWPWRNENDVVEYGRPGIDLVDVDRAA